MIKYVSMVLLGIVFILGVTSYAHDVPTPNSQCAFDTTIYSNKIRAWKVAKGAIHSIWETNKKDDAKIRLANEITKEVATWSKYVCKSYSKDIQTLGVHCH